MFFRFIRFLLVLCFENLLSRHLDFLFILLTVFPRAENVSFNEVQLVSLFFYGCENSVPNISSPGFYPTLSPRSFLVFCFTFKPMIHFVLILVKGVRRYKICM